ncbi:MAG TPA: c-type cytochrome [Puia sp.]|nr:c-type cytochrome [Puia sp.]
MRYLVFILFLGCSSPSGKNNLWHPPDAIPPSPEGELIRYGRELIVNTSLYLGPKGSVAAISNGMNCQNCHLDAGTRAWGNNYSAVFSTYPKFRDRSGAIESIYKRINDCIQRSLDGQPLDTTGREMQAIYAYMKWLGRDVPKGSRPSGVGISELPCPDRAADTLRGSVVYTTKCARCHGPQGAGMLYPDSCHYIYPPLWGPHSYNTGAGLFRLSRLAGYVKDNMPFGLASHNAPQLTDAEAWDVAAYINSRPRPEKTFPADWPDLSRKPFDHPFGPYADSFSEVQHKYGPFGPIKAVLARKPTAR